MQLQDTDEPESLHNPLVWTTRRLATLYNSSYAAESKGLSEACALLAEHHDFIRGLWPQISFVMFTDNQSLANSINGSHKPHPFASSIIDFVRQQLSNYGCDLKWIRSHQNLADQLTKYKRFW